MRTSHCLLPFVVLICAQRTLAQSGKRPSCEPADIFSAEPCRPPVFSASIRKGTLDSRLQLVIPAGGRVEYTVLIVGGGLVGHVAFTTDIWRAMCARFHCALAHFDVNTATPPTSAAEDPGRNASAGSGEAVLALLDTVAKQARRPELAKSKLAVFGFSATGSFAVTFASRYPERTLTAVRYHSHLRGLPLDTTTAARVPVLLVASTDDSTAGVDDTRALWLAGRRLGAPWALAVETGRGHSSLDSWYAVSDLVWHWIETLGKRAVTPADEGWFGEMATRVISHSGSGASPLGLSWFPDSITADAWRRLHGR